MTKALGATKKASNKRQEPAKALPKPLFISHINKLSAASMEALGLSEDDIYKLSGWWSKYVQRAHLKQEDERHNDCNFLVVAMENENGEAAFRWETYHHLAKQDEYFENGIEGVMKVVYGSEEDELEGLGIDHWDSD